ncbi:amino acid adenylation domain-containing protein [Actinoplanes oblitus]|uniref:Phenyloxazoline synthase MbtB n=1 Tax=Actinoplanes oblitus TaxID=3040509 RepID=A0ABY8WRR5_9ACTN|nr:non-ribosomal peptide synthetase [Actinoplanes oblitus]WIN00602.1 amino acid adenylation domain-containing protein [Actinoplanes oblitus]
MAIVETVTALRAAGMVLYAEGDNLRYQAPKGVATPERLRWLRDHKPEILAVLRAGGDEFGVTLTAAPEQSGEPFPLTEVQSAYLLGRGSAFEFGGVACHGYLELAVPDWPVDEVEAAWNRLVARHDMLRATVAAEGFQQVAAEVPHYTVVHADLRDAGPEAVRSAIADVREQLSHRVRPTDRWPLFDLRATSTPDGLLLHFSIDLLICDYSSFRLLLDELRREVTGEGGEVTPAVTFRDYVLALRGLRETERYRCDREYWLSRIDDLPAAPELPVRADAPRAAPRFTRLATRLTEARWQQLHRRATELGVTASTAVLGAYAETIGRWSRHPRFALSLTVQNRLPLHPDVPRIIGDFSSVSLLDVDTTPSTAFGERLATLHARLWEDLDHRLCGGVEVLREIARRRGRAAAAMPVTFTSTVSGAPAPGAGLMPGARLTYGISQTPQVWIDCQMMAEDGGLLLHWDVRDGVLPDGVAADMFAAFTALVERLADGDATDEVDPVVLPRRQRELVAAANDTAEPRVRGPLHARFVDRARRDPGRVAVIAAGRTLTYGELLARAESLARLLHDAGCEPGERVGVIAPKGVEQVVAVLGILLASAAYLPVDLGQPARRRDTILRDAGVRIVVTDSAHAAELAASGVTTIEADRLPAVPGRPAEAPEPAGADLAYVIYTSGSTGTPKGVMISHEAARNTVDDINRRFGVGADDRVLGLAQLGFDLSVYDVFGPLSVGGALVLPRAERRGDPSHWAELMVTERVSVWNSVPAQMQLLTEYLAAAPGHDLSRLRVVMLSGDWIPVTLPDTVRHHAPTAEVISLGGATEASIWSIHHRVGTVDPDQPSIPYGRPLANQSFHVLDDMLRECPELVVGELYIGGAGVALGYLGDEARTAERFVDHPRDGRRLYRTGDLGRRLPDGEIEFLGREDGQIKIRGHRIEVAEIEAALLAHPGVQAAAVIPYDDEAGRHLAAFVEPAAAARAPLPERLPETMAAAAAARIGAVDQDQVAEMVELLDRTALQSISRLLVDCGLFAGGWARHTDQEIIETVKAAPANHYLVRRWLGALEHEGLVRRDPDTGAYHDLTRPDEAEARRLRDRIDTLEPAVRWGAELVRYHRASEEHLQALVRNDIDLKTLLFPHGRLDTAEAAYRDNLISRHNNAAVIAALRTIAAGHAGGAPLRILEIGAGVGGTSTELIPALDGLDVEYLFTDLSHFFLNAAAERFAAYPWVRFGLFDLNADHVEQRMPDNGFDVILLANVLHNAVHAGRALDLLRRLVRPGGWLVFIEATRDAYHVMTSMEFNAGLTGFEDERRETGTTFVPRDRWLSLLDEAGAEVVATLPAADDALSLIGQHVFVSRFKADRAPLEAEDVRRHLAERLPEYMLPAQLHTLDRIPLTGNAKVDRGRLARWTAGSGHHTAGSVASAPADDTERLLAGVWCEILPVTQVGRDTDFFAAGGDSLLVAQLVGRIRDRLPAAREVEWDQLLRRVLNRPTIADIATYLRSLEASGPAPAPSSLVSVGDRARGPATGPGQPLHVLVHDGTGTLIPYRSLVHELSPDVPMAGLVLDDEQEYLDSDPHTLTGTLARRHAATLVAAGHEEVHLIGYCMGGLLVTELATLLAAAGIRVAATTIISSYRVPYLVEDDLLAEYIFARVMRADPIRLGYPADETETQRIVAGAVTRHGGRVPEGSLLEPGAAGVRPETVAGFRRLAAMDPDERLTAIGAAMPVADAGLTSLDRLRRQFRIVKHSLVAVAAHRPTPYDGELTFVRQSGEAQVFPGMHRDMSDYWHDVCTGELHVVDVPGDHFTCMRPPNVPAVARAVRLAVPRGGHA